MQPTQNTPNPQDTTLEDAIAEFISYAQKEGGGGNYARESQRVIENWHETHVPSSVTRVADLHDQHLADYARHLKRRAHNEDISGRTAHVYYARVRAFLTYCKKWGYLADNPAAKQKVVNELPEESSGNTGGDQQFWSAKERAQLTRYADKRAHKAIDDRGFDAVEEARDRALVYLLAYSGARVGEIVRDPNDERRDGIRWRDLDVEGGTITVLGKSQDDEEVQLPTQTHGAIERYREILDPPSEDWPVFPTNHAPTLYETADEKLPRVGVDAPETVLQDRDVMDVLREYDCPPPNITTISVRRILKRLCEEGDIDVEDGHDYLKPHGARRGVGEVLYREKGHASAQRALRHADPSTTSKMYSHIEASELADEASDAFENVDR